MRAKKIKAIYHDKIKTFMNVFKEFKLYKDNI